MDGGAVCDNTPLLPIIREPDLQRESDIHTHSLMLTPIPSGKRVPSKWVEAVCIQAACSAAMEGPGANVYK